MRSMGRRLSDASPMSVKVPCCGGEKAGDHAHGGAGVAAVERDRQECYAAADAVDFNAAVIGERSFAPRASMQPRVVAQSAPVEKLRSRDVPSANAPSMA